VQPVSFPPFLQLSASCVLPSVLQYISSVVIRVARCLVFDRTVQFFGDLSGQKYDAKPDN